MELMGDILRVERQRRSMELEQVAAATKIGVRFLQAIEANRFELLPGGLFTRSFLRQYARALELDEGNVIAAFKEQFEAKEDALPLPLPMTTRTRDPLDAFVRLAGARRLGLRRSVWILARGTAKLATAHSRNVPPGAA